MPKIEQFPASVLGLRHIAKALVLFLVLTSWTLTSYALSSQALLAAADSLPDPSPTDSIAYDTPPQPLNYPDVVATITFPQQGVDYGVAGPVAYRLLLDTLGQPQRSILLNTPDAVLTAAVAAHLPALRFTPAMQGGRKVKAWVTVAFTFQLDTYFPFIERRLGRIPAFPKEINLEVAPPRLLSPTTLKVVYPQEGLQAGLEGTVALALLVSDKGGAVFACQVVQSPGVELVMACAPLVDQLRFEPALKDGQPVYRWMYLIADFDLGRQSVRTQLLPKLRLF